MAKKNCELAVQDQAALTKASELLGALWQGVQEGLGQERVSIQANGLYPDSLREAEVAISLVDGWGKLSDRLIKNPRSLTLRSCGITRLDKLVETGLPDGDGGNLSLRTKYSTVETITDNKPENHRFPLSPEESVPQLEIRLTELYSDSAREALAAISGIRGSQCDVGLTSSACNNFGKVDELEMEAFLAGSIVARKLSVLGKGTWYDPKRHEVTSWGLAGFEITEDLISDICPIGVKRRMRFGRNDDQTNLHPVAFQHDLLAETAPALFTAVEPLTRMVIKNIEKSKR